MTAGPAGFTAALLNILVLQTITWIFVPTGPMLVFTALPVFLVDVGIAFALSRANGRLRQIGWGMLIGCLAVLVTMVGGGAIFLGAHALG